MPTSRTFIDCDVQSDVSDVCLAIGGLGRRCRPVGIVFDMRMHG